MWLHCTRDDDHVVVVAIDDLDHSGGDHLHIPCDDLLDRTVREFYDFDDRYDGGTDYLDYRAARQGRSALHGSGFDPPRRVCDVARRRPPLDVDLAAGRPRGDLRCRARDV